MQHVSLAPQLAENTRKQEEHVDERRRQTDRERSNQAAKCKATQKQSLRTINEEERFH